MLSAFGTILHLDYSTPYDNWILARIMGTPN
jgi:hypothetical protein